MDTLKPKIWSNSRLGDCGKLKGEGEKKDVTRRDE
jgi:hypothetical protein